eukprot:TRINITY_DN6264_c0_g2_i1.p1 TRINITY_DN6264_c0_g2~~TRINITY_DN6264_c0_g2_i1.p1  ORF type:complete len:105 (-),score=16.01 TRINITY_DN6264_c0_g2_i1:27-341(-)
MTASVPLVVLGCILFFQSKRKYYFAEKEKEILVSLRSEVSGTLLQGWPTTPKNKEEEEEEEERRRKEKETKRKRKEKKNYCGLVWCALTVNFLCEKNIRYASTQ